jgi:hypothetical protein
MVCKIGIPPIVSKWPSEIPSINYKKSPTTAVNNQTRAHTTCNKVWKIVLIYRFGT